MEKPAINLPPNPLKGELERLRVFEKFRNIILKVFIVCLSFVNLQVPPLGG